MKRQRGYVNAAPDLVGCCAIVAVLFVFVGIGVAAVAPKVWAWLKPILQGWLA